MVTNHETIEFENDRVKVSRVKLDVREKRPARARKDRVIVYLTGAHHARTESNSKKEEFRRQGGEVIWRPASHHEIENLGDQPVEVLIVELKS